MRPHLAPFVVFSALALMLVPATSAQAGARDHGQSVGVR